jgi:hypothetical protein
MPEIPVELQIGSTRLIIQSLGVSALNYISREEIGASQEY